MNITLVITICGILGCLPPLTHDNWKFETEEQCMYKGYYHIAEVAETYMKTVGIEEFKKQKIKMLYNCFPIEKLNKEPVKLEKDA
jgi:hypothetical protein|tara:strand:- start:1333 stop:1587 length:255 start_codon:yes stop_codon:yes gene_type:complete